jgi:hypothetical protein
MQDMPAPVNARIRADACRNFVAIHEELAAQLASMRRLARPAADGCKSSERQSGLTRSALVLDDACDASSA